MILSDGDILDELNEGELVIEPVKSYEEQVQPGSFDIRLGHNFKWFDFEKGDLDEGVNIREGVPEKFIGETTIEDGETYTLYPDQDFALGTTIERVEIPPHLLATVEGRSSIGRLAIKIHSTAGVVDPGYEGQITLELTNESPVPMDLVPGMRVGQLIFKEMKSEADRPYGRERGSKYQNQQGATVSRIEEDRENQ